MLHRRIAAALEQEPGQLAVELLAYHYDRAGVVEKALLYLERAGDKAQAEYANATAEGYYREVVDRIRERNDKLILNLTTGPGGRYDPSDADPAVAGPRIMRIKLRRPRVCVKRPNSTPIPSTIRSWSWRSSGRATERQIRV